MMKKPACSTFNPVRVTILICVFLAWCHLETKAGPDTLVQLNGLVMSSDSLMALPYTTVYEMSSGNTASANYRGFFSLVVHKGDTVRFSSIGYHTDYFVVPDSLKGSRYSVIQLMTRDTIFLAETVIYPWPSKEDFKEAFLALDIPEDDLERARKNLDREKLKEMALQTPADANETQDYYARKEADSYYYYGQTPPMNIFSPLAWAKFIQAWKDGKFKKQ